MLEEIVNSASQSLTISPNPKATSTFFARAETTYLERQHAEVTKQGVGEGVPTREAETRERWCCIDLSIASRVFCNGDTRPFR